MYSNYSHTAGTAALRNVRDTPGLPFACNSSPITICIRTPGQLAFHRLAVSCFTMHAVCQALKGDRCSALSSNWMRFFHQCGIHIECFHLATVQLVMLQRAKR